MPIFAYINQTKKVNIMAYVSTEQAKEVRNELKKALPSKDGFKLSVTVQHYSTIAVSIMKSPIRFEKSYEQINHYYTNNIEDRYQRAVLEIITKTIDRVLGASEGEYHDTMTDCFHNNYFVALSVGKWDKPCEFIN
jgi:predicted P-loop ATPase/GTPase